MLQCRTMTALALLNRLQATCGVSLPMLQKKTVSSEKKTQTKRGVKLRTPSKYCNTRKSSARYIVGKARSETEMTLHMLHRSNNQLKIWGSNLTKLAASNMWSLTPNGAEFSFNYRKQSVEWSESLTLHVTMQDNSWARLKVDKAWVRTKVSFNTLHRGSILFKQWPKNKQKNKQNNQMLPCCQFG